MGLSVVIVLLSVILTTSPGFAFAQSTSEPINDATSRKFNIVFVIDNSGSTRDTDPEVLRKEAINEFIAIMTNTGNKVGGIVFNDKMTWTDGGLKAIESANDKSTVSSFFELPPQPGSTDIGSALLTATQMLDSTRDPNLQSAIILMTDGRTQDLPASAMDQSYINRDEAIKSAVANKYRVYCVGLDADGSVDSTDLQRIADETGGQYERIGSADDLQKVFDMFYDLLYGTSRTTIYEGEGSFDVKFKVPAVGVEDVNVTIYSSQNLKSLALYQPSGTGLTQDDVDSISTVSKTFTVVKIDQPLRGEWRITGEGVDNDHIRIDMTQNYNLGVVAGPKTVKDDGYPIDVPLEYMAQISFNNEIVTSPGAYEDYSATILFKNSKSDEIKEISMTVGENGDSYEYALPLPAEGLYYATVTLENEYFKTNSDPYEINVYTPVTPKAIAEKIPPWVWTVVIIAIIAVAAAIAALKVRKYLSRRCYAQIKITIIGIDADIDDTITLDKVNKAQFTLRELLNAFGSEIGHGRIGQENQAVLQHLVAEHQAELDRWAFSADAKDSNTFYYGEAKSKAKTRYTAANFSAKVPLSQGSGVDDYYSYNQKEIHMVGIFDDDTGIGPDIWDDPSSHERYEPDIDWDNDRDF
jgi:Mg-chelatase subunit ChlD